VIADPIPLVRKEMVAWFEFCIHGRDFGTNRKNQKTYGRFLGMIFGGGCKSAFVLERQGFAEPKIPKKRKNVKKSVKYFSGDPRFSAKPSVFSGAEFFHKTPAQINIACARHVMSVAYDYD